MNNFVKQDVSKCSGCGLCVTVCRKKAIQLEESNDGFLYPVINNDLCIKCSACINICPFNSETASKLTCNSFASYLFKHSEEIRIQSASGGFFTALSDYILENNGIVYGAIFDNQYKILHIRCDNYEQRNQLRGSKYAQSIIDDDTYKNIKTDIKNGRLVLFTGTPCQCAAVKRMYKDNVPENLIIMDIICHGVLAQKVLRQYIDYIEKNNKKHSKVIKVNLRDKQFGWEEPGLTFSDGYKYHSETDCFYPLYSMNSLQRKSCFNCKYARKERTGDFTVGDFWGMKSYYPDLYDELGVSLVLVNTDKGRNIFNEIERNPLVLAKQIHPREYENVQPNLMHPTIRGERADKFESYYKRYGFEKTVHRFFDITLQRRFNSMIYSFVKKVRS